MLNCMLTLGWILGRVPGSVGRRHFLAIPGPRFWRTLSVYMHPEPALALPGGVSHLPLTQGDGVGVSRDLLLMDPLGGAL